MLVSDKEEKKRKAICNTCEFKKDNFELFNVVLWKRKAQCKVCKCFIDAKTKFDFAECPKNKW